MSVFVNLILNTLLRLTDARNKQSGQKMCFLTFPGLEWLACGQKPGLHQRAHLEVESSYNREIFKKSR